MCVISNNCDCEVMLSCEQPFSSNSNQSSILDDVVSLTEHITIYLNESFD